MTTFFVKYRVKGYTLADAFRPQPGWGYREFTAESEKLGTDDIEEVKTAAIQTAPEGYEFHSIAVRGGNRLATSSAAKGEA